MNCLVTRKFIADVHSLASDHVAYAAYKLIIFLPISISITKEPKDL